MCILLLYFTDNRGCFQLDFTAVTMDSNSDKSPLSIHMINIFQKRFGKHV